MTDTDSLRKYAKKVDRNGWQAKIYRYVKGREPRFAGYCPFFWAVWLCFLAAPFVYVGRILLSFFSFVNEIFTDKIETYRKNQNAKVEQKEPKFIPDDEFLVSANKYNPKNLYNIVLEYSCSAFEWLEENPSWRDLVPAAQERLDAKRKREQEIFKAAELRAEKLKKVVKPLMYTSGAVATYYIVKFIIFLVGLVTWDATLMLLKQVGVLILFFSMVAAGVFTIGFLLYSLGKLIKFCIHKSRTEDSFLKCVVWAGVCETYHFLKETIKMAYIKECPLIEWGEESGNIKRRK